MEEANNIPVDADSASEDNESLDTLDVSDLQATDAPGEVDDYTYVDPTEPAVDAAVAAQRFNELYARHNDQLRAMVHRRVPPDLLSAGFAESVISDVYAALYDRLLIGPMHENPGAWLTLVAKRKIADEFRRYNRRNKKETPDYFDDEEHESLLEQQLGKAAVAEHHKLNDNKGLRELAAVLLSAVTKEQRKLLVSWHILEKGTSEIAARLTEKEQHPVTRANVRLRLTRARQAAAKAYANILAEQGLPEQTHFTRFLATLEEARERD